jgi:hypothetical protein
MIGAPSLICQQTTSLPASAQKDSVLTPFQNPRLEFILERG